MGEMEGTVGVNQERAAPSLVSSRTSPIGCWFTVHAHTLHERPQSLRGSSEEREWHGSPS